MRSVNFIKSFALFSALSLVQTAFGAYLNGTNSTSSAVPSSTPTASPYLVGSDNGGSPLWYLHVPGELGPWVELTFSSAGGSNYQFDFDAFTFSESEDITVSSTGNSFTITYTGAAPAGEFLAGLFTSRTVDSASLFGITVYVAIDTGSGDLRKRDVLTWTLTDYITISPTGTSVSESSSVSGPYTYSSYTVVTLTVSGTETVTVTVPCESGTPITPAPTGPVTLYTTTETVIAGVTTTVTVPCSTASGYPGAAATTAVSVYAGAASQGSFVSKSSAIGYTVAIAVSYVALVAL